MAALLLPLAVAGVGFGLIAPAVNDLYRGAKNIITDEYNYLTESGEYAPHKEKTIADILKASNNRAIYPLEQKKIIVSKHEDGYNKPAGIRDVLYTK